MSAIGLPPSPLPGLAVVELAAGSEALLQQFFQANPEYFLAVTGAPPGPTDAHDEIHEGLPPGWPYTRQWILGYATESGPLAAMANIVADLLAPGVWHISTFIVATQRHGTGDAAALFNGLQAWAIAHGAQWLRLGVVAGHARAERFWSGRGFQPVRQRVGVTMGARLNTVRVMVKPLAGGTLDEYLAQVRRDHPDSD